MYSVIVGTFVASHQRYGENQAVTRIISFTNRREGWRFGKGERPNLNTIACALKIANFIINIGVPKTGAFLGEDGSIAVTGYAQSGRGLEVTCYSGELLSFP